MNPPFGTHDFFGVFTAYNQAIWPAQLGLLALALAIVTAAVCSGPASGSVILGGLSVLWFWCGAVFQLAFFARLTPAGYGFGALFLLQAGLFAFAAARSRGAPLALRVDRRGLLGALMITYALFAYPLLASSLGQMYPAVPSFGAPCPLTIFTFGILLLSVGRLQVHLLVIPLAWSLTGSMAALRWGVLEDVALPLVGVAGTAAALLHNHRVGTDAAAGVGETPARSEGIRRLH